MEVLEDEFYLRKDIFLLRVFFLKIGTLSLVNLAILNSNFLDFVVVDITIVKHTYLKVLHWLINLVQVLYMFDTENYLTLSIMVIA